MPARYGKLGGRHVGLGMKVGALGAWMLALLLSAPGLAADANFRDRVVQVLKQTPLIDGHNDLPREIRERFTGRLSAIDLRSDTSKIPVPTNAAALMTGIARLRAGLVGGQFWSVWVPVEIKGPEAVQTTARKYQVHENIAAMTSDGRAAFRSSEIAVHRDVSNIEVPPYVAVGAIGEYTDLDFRQRTEAAMLVRAPTRVQRDWILDSRQWAGYRPRAGDVIIATAPKAGTTWLQQIVSLLIFQSPLPRSLAALSPWLEFRLNPPETSLSMIESQEHRHTRT